MHITQLYDRIQRKLSERLEDVQAHILGGTAVETYKADVARYREIILISEEIEAIYSRAVKEDDNDD